MDTPHKAQLDSFTLENIPELDTVVLAALELFSHTQIPAFPMPEGKKTLIVGSVNALSTGKIMFTGENSIFADESSFRNVRAQNPEIDSVAIISSSGGKHAVEIAQKCSENGVAVHLITNNPSAPAAKYLEKQHIHIFPKNREPYTYNTSTYLGMILSSTGEDPSAILKFIEDKVEPNLMRNFQDYSAFTFIVPGLFGHVRDMMRTKFDELFGPHVIGRIFTEEEVKHAKTIVTSGDELFIGLDVSNKYYGLSKNRLTLPLPENADYAAVLAIGYYVIGKIQTAHPPYFKNKIEEYCKTVSEIFGQEINPIVE